MGVRYGSSTLLVIFLVVTGQLIYPLPTVTNLKFSSFSITHHNYFQHFKADVSKKDLTKQSLNLNENEYNPVMGPNSVISVVKRSANSSFTVKFSSQRNYLSSKRRHLNNNEQYTIEVLPSPSRPIESKKNGGNLNHDPNMGIGIVADYGKYHTTGDKTVKNHFYSSKTGSELPDEQMYSDHVTIDIQFLPWGEGLTVGEGSSNCLNPDVISRAARLALKRNPPPAGVTLVVHPPPKDFKCTERHAVEYFLNQLTLSSTRILIGAVEPSLCRVASHLAEKYDKLLILWSCFEIPTSDKSRLSFEEASIDLSSNGSISNKTNANTNYRGNNGYGHVAMVTPLANQVARSVRAALQHLGWRKVSIITIDSRYWLGVSQILDAELRAWHHLVPAIQVLSKDYNDNLILNLIKKVIRHDVKAFLMVLPSASAVLGSVMRIAGTEGLTQHAALILVDPLLEPKPHYSPFSENHSVVRPKNVLTESDSDQTDTRSEGIESIERSESKNNKNKIYRAPRNRTRGISILTEKDIKLTKLKNLEKLKKQQQAMKSKSSKALEKNSSVEVTNSSYDKTHSNRQLLSENDKNSLVTENINESEQNSTSEEEMPSSHFVANSDTGNISQIEDENSFPILENVMFKTPEHLASLPIEVARSVFLSVPKSIGRNENSFADNSNSTASGDWEDDEPSQKMGEDLHFDNENDAILGRLTYDSVSLASHILRKNVAVIILHKERKERIRRKRTQPQEVFSKMNKKVQLPEQVTLLKLKKRSDKKLRDIEHPNPINRHRAGFYTSEKAMSHENRRRRKRRVRDQVSRAKFGEEEHSLEDEGKVRDQIFHEVKRLQEHTDKEAEQRLENILRYRTPSFSPTSVYARSRSNLGRWGTSNKVETKLSFSTTFRALAGEGFIHASGIRNFEFLLLDWKPSLEALVPVLRIHETNISGIEHSTNSTLRVEVLAVIDWAFDAPIPSDPMCELLGVPCIIPSMFPSMTPGYITLLAVGIIIAIAAVCTAAVFIRNWLLQKEMSKGPYKILLNSTDITLAARADSAPRKVSEPSNPSRKVNYVASDVFN